MSSTSLPQEGARSADELNEQIRADLNAQIRALFTHRDVRLTNEQRAEYQRLLAALRDVERGDVATAA